MNEIVREAKFWIFREFLKTGIGFSGLEMKEETHLSNWTMMIHKHGGLILDWKTQRFATNKSRTEQSPMLKHPTHNIERPSKLIY